VGVAELQKALEDGMLVCGRNLHGDTGMLSHKVGHVTWTTAVASAVPLIEKVAPLLRELLRLCPNTLIPGKKLDLALMGCHKAISGSAKFEMKDAESLSEKLRQLSGKIRKMTDGKEYERAMQKATVGQHKIVRELLSLVSYKEHRNSLGTDSQD
ncbi:unnamed protein product, partial [Cladocopium goreaui]